MSGPNPKCPECKGQGVVYVKQESKIFPNSVVRFGKICDCMKAAVASLSTPDLITFKRKLEKVKA